MLFVSCLGSCGASCLGACTDNTYLAYPTLKTKNGLRTIIFNDCEYHKYRDYNSSLSWLTDNENLYVNVGKISGMGYFSWQYDVVRKPNSTDGILYARGVVWVKEGWEFPSELNTRLDECEVFGYDADKEEYIKIDLCKNLPAEQKYFKEFLKLETKTMLTRELEKFYIDLESVRFELTFTGVDYLTLSSYFYISEGKVFAVLTEDVYQLKEEYAQAIIDLNQ